MKLQLSAALLSSLTTGVVVLAQDVTIPLPAPGCVAAADCWCIPDEPTDPNATAVCPEIGSRINVLNFTSTAPKIGFFGSFVPYENGLFELDPPGCQPFPKVAGFFNLTACDGVAQGGYSTKSSKSSKSGYEQVCAFDYSGDVCDGGSYGLYNTKAGKSQKEDSRMLKKAKKDAKKGKKDAKKDAKKGKKDKTSKGGITHESSCGVCSSAQDLVALMSPLLLEGSRNCAFATAVQLKNPAVAPTVLPDAIACHKALGFTDECATVWGSGAVATVLEVAGAAIALVPGSRMNYTGPASCTQCAVQCLSDPTTPACVAPFIGETCELSPCVACEEEAIEPIFQQFSGRTRRRSGILGADIKRPCSKTAGIDQPFVTCPVPTAAPDPVVPAPDPVVPAPAPDPVVPAPDPPAPADDD